MFFYLLFVNIANHFNHFQVIAIFLKVKCYGLNGVDVFVTSECIHLYILCIVPRCLFREVSVMCLSHVMPRCYYREIQ